MSAVKIADDYLEKSRACFGESQLSQAVALAHNAVAMYKSVGLFEKAAISLNFMGVVYSALGDSGMSIDCYMEAMDLAMEHGYDEVVMLVDNNIGSMYLDLGKYEKSIHYFKEAMEKSICPEHGDRSQYYVRMLLMNLNLCIAYTGTDSYEEAEAYLQEAILYSEIVDDNDNKFLIDITQAQLLWKLGNGDDVREHVDELAREAVDNISVSDYVMEIQNLCNLFMEMGEFEAWKYVITEYQKYAEETDNIHFLKTCVKMWMKYYRAVGHMDAYNSLCVRYVYLHTQQESMQLERLSETIDIKVELQRKEIERKKAVQLNYIDMLTGLGNKFSMRKDFEEKVQQRAGKGGITVGIVDIDHFKAFNKSGDRITGDDAIRTIAEVITNSIGENGTGYHFYGDEFYIILENTNRETIEIIARTVKDYVRECEIVNPSPDGKEYMTVSQAYVIMEDIKLPDEYARVLKQVDSALTEVKEAGRDDYRII